MQHSLTFDRKWKKAELYALYWAGYVLLFTLIEGSTEGDFLRVFRNEVISLAPKALFVWLVIEYLSGELLAHRKIARFTACYILLIVACALVMRLIDNYIILPYFLPQWTRESLFSAPPFLYNIIKLQFVLMIPFCIALYEHLSLKHQQPSVTLPQASLRIKCERRMIDLRLEDICYCEAQGNYLEIVTVSGTYKTYMSISAIQEKLPVTRFIRIHRSFIIDLRRVESRNHASVTINGKLLPIGRSYSSDVKRYF